MHLCWSATYRTFTHTADICYYTFSIVIWEICVFEMNKQRKICSLIFTCIDILVLMFTISSEF